MTSQGCLLCCRLPTLAPSHPRPQPRCQSAAGSANSNAFPKGPRTRLRPRQVTAQNHSSPSGGVAPTAIGRLPSAQAAPPKVPAPRLQSPALLTEAPHAWSPSRGRPLGLAVRGGRWEVGGDTTRAPAPWTSVHQPHPRGALGWMVRLDFMPIPAAVPIPHHSSPTSPWLT